MNPETDPLVIMVAPNGARRTKVDHPALPITDEELAETAAACVHAGSTAIHLHVRDAEARHVLDAGLYRDAVAAVRARVGAGMVIQVTTEAVGRYSPEEQMELVRTLRPAAVSVALRELLTGGEAGPAAFYCWASDHNVSIQHILYDRADLDRFAELRQRGLMPGARPQLLFVLGRYALNQESRPEDLDIFIEGLDDHGLHGEAVWSICAFGRGETAALASAIRAGGHVRVGFENSLWNADGSIARDNAERVSAIAAEARRIGRRIASAAEAGRILGVATA